MLDDFIAQDITVQSVRATGQLYPINKHPIGMEKSLGECRVRGEGRLEEVKVRIIKRLRAIEFDIDKDTFRDIDEDTLVGDLVTLVTGADPLPEERRRKQ